ncbi:MAG TPA: WD40 repeat domain-containing protein, partial [Acidimicrobiales bacterium]|nr:WD40 repeat domain-containing protein [Acidimicrobiales bacterium]
AHSYRRVNVDASGNSSVLAVAYNPAGTELAVAGGTAVANGETGFVLLYRLVAPGTTERFTTGDGEFSHVAFSRDGHRLAAAAADGHVYLFDARASSLASPAQIAVGEPVNVVAFSRDGTLATGDNLGTVRLWDPQRRAQIGETMAEGSVVYGLAFAPDGRSLCAGGLDGSPFVWTATGQSPLARRIVTGSDLHQLAISADGGELVTLTTVGRNGGVATAWDLRSGRPVGRRAPEPASAIATSPDGQVQATAVAVAPGGAVALGLGNGDVLIDSPTLTSTLETLPGTSQVNVLAFSPDGRELAAGLSSGTTILWRLRPRPRQTTLSFPRGLTTGGVQALAFAPNGETLAVASELAGTDVFGLRPGAGSFPNVNSSMFALAFEPSSATLVGGDNSGNVEVLDPRSNRITATLPGDGNVVYEVALAPDGETLAAGDSTGLVRLWDLASQQELGIPIPASEHPIFGAAYSTTGELVTGGADGTVIVWPALFVGHDLGAFARELCPRLSANLSALEWSQDVTGQPYHATCPGLPPG